MTMVINSNGTSIDYDAAVELMDDDLREEVAADLAPCTEQEFFTEYCKRHAVKFGALWELDKSNPHILTLYFTLPTLAGLFFCLASAEGAGLLFCSSVIQPHASIYSAFCAVHASYTTHATKQRTGLYRGVSVDLPHSSAHNTAATQANYAPPAPRRTLYKSAQPPYYNKIQGCSIPQTMSTWRGLDASHARQLEP